MGLHRGIRWVVALLSLALAVVSAGCTENKAATRACGAAVNHTACKACCGMHGSSVTSNWSGCTCY